MSQWRRDHPAMSRGRRREHVSDELRVPDNIDFRQDDSQQTIHPFPNPNGSSPIFFLPHSHAYHISSLHPSLSKVQLLITISQKLHHFLLSLPILWPSARICRLCDPPLVTLDHQPLSALAIVPMDMFRTPFLLSS